MGLEVVDDHDITGLEGVAVVTQIEAMDHPTTASESRRSVAEL
jgi:hypothetical protein